ncbi:MAG: hypothetical protein NTZ78_03290 [Candidatus Aureabacteria bacterium]|nr:hypothetical protein [Candidatus Auribacterota bacterium]
MRYFIIPFMAALILLPSNHCARAASDVTRWNFKDISDSDIIAPLGTPTYSLNQEGTQVTLCFDVAMRQTRDTAMDNCYYNGSVSVDPLNPWPQYPGDEDVTGSMTFTASLPNSVFVDSGQVIYRHPDYTHPGFRVYECKMLMRYAYDVLRGWEMWLDVNGHHPKIYPMTISFNVNYKIGEDVFAPFSYTDLDCDGASLEPIKWPTSKRKKDIDREWDIMPIIKDLQDRRAQADNDSGLCNVSGTVEFNFRNLYVFLRDFKNASLNTLGITARYADLLRTKQYTNYGLTFRDMCGRIETRLLEQPGANPTPMEPRSIPIFLNKYKDYDYLHKLKLDILIGELAALLSDARNYASDAGVNEESARLKLADRLDNILKSYLMEYDRVIPIMADDPDAPPDNMLDDSAVEADPEGVWTKSINAPGGIGKGYRYAAARMALSQPLAQFTWELELPRAGTYRIYARWTAEAYRASNAEYIIRKWHGGAPSIIDTVTVNQKIAGGQWMLLGRYGIEVGDTLDIVLNNDGKDGYVIADAIDYIWEPNIEDDKVTILDNQQLGLLTENKWKTGANVPGYFGSDYAYCQVIQNSPSPGLALPVMQESGVYDVYLRWTAGSNRAQNGRVVVMQDGNHDKGGGVPINQTSPVQSSTWVRVGSVSNGLNYHLWVYTPYSSDYGKYVVVDAVKFVKRTWLPTASSPAVIQPPDVAAVPVPTAMPQDVERCEFSLKVSSGTVSAGENLGISLAVPAADSVVDGYLAVRLPKGALLVIDGQENIGTSVEPFMSGVSNASAVSKGMEIVIPEGIPSGDYILGAVMVPHGADPLDTTNWLSPGLQTSHVAI